MPTYRELANAIRVLSMDAVEQAQSGHPGAPLGMADIAEVLWRDYLVHNPKDPQWLNRDRFVLSNGHASMLLYALLHLRGYDLAIQDIKRFRQLDSKTPGHPELGCAPGVETTTGPLGQGLGNAVGMALAEKNLAAQFNRPGFDLINHYTYVFTGDGCLMEGISHEACSLAGTLKLGKLIVFYDDNKISIDGAVQGWFTDDTAARFRSYQWQVIDRVDGHARDALVQAVEAARAETEKPTLICCQTIIGWGAPNKQGSADCHGAPLGKEEIMATRKQLNWTHPPFEVPPDIQAAWSGIEQGKIWQTQWEQQLKQYCHQYPELGEELVRRCQQQVLPKDWSDRSSRYIHQVHAAKKDMATRKASGLALQVYSGILPELIGGSADLAGSNVTLSAISKAVTEHSDGNYIYFGVREFAMTTIANGLAVHGGMIPYAATFLTFSDYARNAVRMAALMERRVILVYTHDSVGLGEDGPTHQPVEHLSALRLIPNLFVWRPCDAVETAVAWKMAIECATAPSALALSRQTLPAIERSPEQLANIARGAYIVDDCSGLPAVVMIATGSEVALALEAKKALADEYNIRVLSMPCAEIFAKQDQAYQQSVLPRAVTKRIVIEAGTSDWWYKYAGLEGCVIGIDTFGKSAPANEVMKGFGFTTEYVVHKVRNLVQQKH